MAQRDLQDGRADADLATLYWWRRDEARESAGHAAGLSQRLVALAERAAAAPRTVALPGNRLRAAAGIRRAPGAPPPQPAIARDSDPLSAIRAERHSALLALAIGLLAAATPMAAAIYAAIMREPVALGFAIAGGVAASCALYHGARWFLLTRADAPPNFRA